MAARSSSFGVSALPVTVFAHLLATALITLVLVWLLHFREGLAFESNNKAKIFNVHPLLMVIGFLILSGEAIMAYKTVPGTRESQKLVHLVLHFLALVAGILGVYAVFKFHNEKGIPNLYTLHSWIGISTISFFGLQWLLGFFSFVWPGADKGARARAAPWHVFFGIAIFFMGIIAALTGLTEKFIFLSLLRTQEAVIVNFTGLLILLFGVSVGLVIILPRRN